MLDSNRPRRAATLRRALLASALCLIVAGLAILPGCGSSGETAVDPTAPRPLILQPEVGVTYTFQSDIEQEIGLTVMGQEVDIFQNITSNIEWRVDSVLANGGFIGQVTHTRFRLNQEGPGTFEEFDTDAPDAEPQSDMSYGMAGMAGVPFKARVTPTGDVTILDGMDAFYNNMADLSGITGAAERDTFRALASGEFTAEDMAQDLIATSFLYVTRPVAPDSTWDVSTTTDAMLPIRLTGTARLDSATLDTTFVSLNAQVASVQDTSGGLFPAGFQNADMSGTTTGTARFDPQTGFALQVDVEQGMSGTAEMQTDRQTLNVDLSVNTRSTVEGSIRTESVEQDR